MRTDDPNALSKTEIAQVGENYLVKITIGADSMKSAARNLERIAKKLRRGTNIYDRRR